MAGRRNVAAVLEAAATLIERNGWCRGSQEKIVGNAVHYCILGAIEAVAARPAVNPTLSALEAELGRNAIAWNDNQRDRRKVVRALRRTARKLTPAH